MDTNINILYHHGIKGQKWGVRRYQNDDGTLTEEGKKRYGVDSSGKMSSEGKKQFKQDRKEALKEAKADLKKHLKEKGMNPHFLETYQDIYERGAESVNFISEKYGNTTLKDYKKDRRRKALIIAGASAAAYIAASAAYLIIKSKSEGGSDESPISPTNLPANFVRDVVGEAVEHSEDEDTNK